jgi:hypothetical protein
MKSSFHNLIPFLTPLLNHLTAISTDCLNFFAPKLISWQAGFSELPGHEPHSKHSSSIVASIHFHRNLFTHLFCNNNCTRYISYRAIPLLLFVGITYQRLFFWLRNSCFEQIRHNVNHKTSCLRRNAA